MNAELVDKIVKAVLYEGYMLYPYRPSAVKNQQRFNFGVVYPREYSEAQGGSEACTMQTECLLTGGKETRCTVCVRFLRMVARTVEKLAAPSLNGEPRFEKVARLEINGKSYHPWQEAVEESIEITEFDLPALISQPMQWPFRLSAKQEKEPIHDARGAVAGLIVRDKRKMAGRIDLSEEQLQEGVFKLRVLICNDSRLESHPASREGALEQSLVSAHTILDVRDGEFISLVDPLEAYRDFARGCQNLGTWPILVGGDGEHDTMLSSPIILYDYPEIAPESPGDLFDGAEIDEILSLRIMTMTDEEKREMRESDERARQILERTEALPEEQWMKLHGALRGLRSAKGEKP
jgi:hypothetical protein